MKIWKHSKSFCMATTTNKEAEMLLEFLNERNNLGAPNSLYSCCSANEDVLSAAMLRSKKTNTPLLIEATANQVNQYGGYTGKTPADFYSYVHSLANSIDLPKNNLYLGGDHLGPLTWSNLPEDQAMEEAETLVRSFVSAGFEKIHLDTSMRLGSDDPSEPFPASVCAERGAILCKACEDEIKVNCENLARSLVYVVGSEVPVPGGKTGNGASDSVTKIEDYQNTIEAYRRAFVCHSLDDAFSRIIAIVVEMGVEFSEYSICHYNKKAFESLSEFAKGKRIRFEAHSTDYQTRGNLREMVRDGAAILKVGPALTFAAKSALFKLELIEKELIDSRKWSDYRKTIDAAMNQDPSKWNSYYKGSDREIAFARAFSFSDRSRYYMDTSIVKS